MKKQALRYINIIPASDHEASFSPGLIREATESSTKHEWRRSAPVKSE